MTRLSEAITTISRLAPILKRDELVGSKIETLTPKKLAMKENKYSRKTPPVAAKRPNLKF